ncbi:MAG: peptide MFS transporter [Gemmatimonadetes bacterium]|nr:peptide MFS transporter [Gemmatimonadota bacterium]
MAKDRSTDPAAGSAAAGGGGKSAGAAVLDRSFLGHPRGLSTLFFTEMWERFSYYGMRALLILFMTAAVPDGGLGPDTASAGAIYGLTVGFANMLALPGGWIADRLIGQRRAVLVGGMLIAAGNFTLAAPGTATFYLGLGLIVMGTGLLKPNVSTMVGELYPEGGARRDAGFSVFYMGINTGAFMAPLITGLVGENINWHLGFAIAGVGMVLGLVQYVLGGKHLGNAGLHPDQGDSAQLSRNWRNLLLGMAVVLAAGLATWFARVPITQVAAGMTVLIVSITFAFFLYVLIFGGLTRQEKLRVGAIAVLFLSSAVFWAGFEQAGSSLNLVAKQLTDRMIFGWELPASWLQSVGPLLIITLAPVAGMLWVWLSNKHLEPSSPAKFAVGLVLLGAGFAVMMLAMMRATQGVQVSPLWLVVTYFLHTCGELSLSPVGLSTVTKLAPHRMVGQMMGIWFMATSLGNLMAGQIAGRIGAAGGAGGEISAQAALTIFTVVTVFGLGYGLLLALFVKPVRKLMAGVH